jgi:hypothetical protein
MGEQAQVLITGWQTCWQTCGTLYPVVLQLEHAGLACSAALKDRTTCTYNLYTARVVGKVLLCVMAITLSVWLAVLVLIFCRLVGTPIYFGLQLVELVVSVLLPRLLALTAAQAGHASSTCCLRTPAASVCWFAGFQACLLQLLAAGGCDY